MAQVKLSPAEQRVFDKIILGDIMCKQLSATESGAIPGLIQKGLIEVYKRNMSPYQVRNIKFARKL